MCLACMGFTELRSKRSLDFARDDIAMLRKAMTREALRIIRPNASLPRWEPVIQNHVNQNAGDRNV